MPLGKKNEKILIIAFIFCIVIMSAAYILYRPVSNPSFDFSVGAKTMDAVKGATTANPFVGLRINPFRVGT